MQEKIYRSANSTNLKEKVAERGRVVTRIIEHTAPYSYLRITQLKLKMPVLKFKPLMGARRLFNNFRLDTGFLSCRTSSVHDNPVRLVLPLLARDTLHGLF